MARAEGAGAGHIAPQVRVKNLASHVLGLSARVVPKDWESAYAVGALLMESFVQRDRFAGTSYKAANWVRVGSTSGRGRQDRGHVGQVPVKIECKALVTFVNRNAHLPAQPPSLREAVTLSGDEFAPQGARSTGV